MPVERWRYPPNPTVARGSLVQLIEVVFFDSVGRISHDGVNRVFRNAAEPFETIRTDDQRLARSFAIVVESKRISFHFCRELYCL